MRSITATYYKPNTFLNLVRLNAPVKIKDAWGMPFEVDAFRVDEVKKGGKCVEICYYKNQLPHMRALKKPLFEGCETEAKGAITIRIGPDKYQIGEWRLA